MDVKFLLAEGMVFVRKELDYLVEIECAAPILRSMMLSKISSPEIHLTEDVPDPRNLNARWLLARIIEVRILLRWNNINISSG